MDKEVVKELIQGEFNSRNLKNELDLILKNPKRENILKDYKELKNKLGGIGASEKTASLIYEKLQP